MKLFYFILALIPFIVLCDESCNRPASLLEFEEACKTDPEVTGNSGSFLEQIQENIAAAMEQTRKLINIAKKKLGITLNDQPEEQQMKKCEYYQCIFRKMNTIGSTNYPNMTLIESWVNDNVDESLKNTSLVKVYSCFNTMAANIATDNLSAVLFSDDIKIINPLDDTTDHYADMGLEDNLQLYNPCDLSAKLMMCLNNDMMMCSAFKYP